MIRDRITWIGVIRIVRIPGRNLLVSRITVIPERNLLVSRITIIPGGNLIIVRIAIIRWTASGVFSIGFRSRRIADQDKIRFWGIRFRNSASHIWGIRFRNSASHIRFRNSALHILFKNSALHIRFDTRMRARRIVGWIEVPDGWSMCVRAIGICRLWRKYTVSRFRRSGIFGKRVQRCPLTACIRGIFRILRRGVISQFRW